MEKKNKDKREVIKVKEEGKSSSSSATSASVLETVGFDTVIASALPFPIAVISV